MPSQPEAQGDILKEFREGTFLSSLDIDNNLLDPKSACGYILPTNTQFRKLELYIPCRRHT